MNAGPDGGGFAADLAALGTHAEQFAALAERTGKIDAALRTALDSSGTAWGTDDVGRSFADGHQPQAEETVHGIGALPGQLARLGEQFLQTAQGYRVADEAAAADLRRDET